MGLTINLRAGIRLGGVGPGIGIVATLLVAIAVVAAVAGVVDMALRPDGVRVAMALLMLAWLVPAASYRLTGQHGPAATTALVALAQAGSSVWAAGVPVAIAAWLVFGLALPDLRLSTAVRRVVAATAGVGAVMWAVWLATTGQAASLSALAAVSCGAAGVGLAAMALRGRRASAKQRHLMHWVAAAVVTIAGTALVLGGLNMLFGTPAGLIPWILGSLALVPLGLLGAQLPGTASAGERILVGAIVVAGLVVFAVVVYLVVVVGLVRPAISAERDILLAGVAATIVVTVLVLPLRARLTNLGRSVTGRAGRPATDVLSAFSARMSRAVPLDELLLQLAESLHATLGPAGAEVWVGQDGVLTRTVSVPHLPNQRLVLSEHERIIIGRARIGGESWSSVWLPSLVNHLSGDPASNGQPAATLLRVAPAAHLGELLGLLVVRRPQGSAAFSANEDTMLVELARQVGLALHNVRLDAALQASLTELRQRNAELQASRLRIVTAADESRRKIERDLHDGAQQRLTALAIKLGLARQLIASQPSIAAAQLEELRIDVQTTIVAVRELAHGIYPPLLRQQGLAAALRTTAMHSPLPCTVTAELAGRYPVQVETAVYFCCLEAIHNADKHAGPDAAITVLIDHDDTRLRFTVSDDGTGFQTGPDGVGEGHGLINMRDRLGAIGGSLEITSTPGNGTTIRGIVPATPVEAANRTQTTSSSQNPTGSRSSSRT